MKNLDSTKYTDDRIKKIGYVVLSGVVIEIVVAAKRIALVKELRSIKMLVEPTNIDLEEDLAILRILKDPHVKLAADLAVSIETDVLQTYGIVNLLDREDIEDDVVARDLGWGLFWRFMFYRQHHRRRDRYINFIRVLLCAQRAVYELLKLIVTGTTRTEDRTYRTNYSPGRVKALLAESRDPMLHTLAELIDQLKDCETKSRAMLT